MSDNFDENCNYFENRLNTSRVLLEARAWRERERDRKKFTIRMLNSNLIILLWCYHVLDTVAVVIVVAVARCNRRTDFINLDMNERSTRQIYCSNENLSHNLCNVLCKMKSR